MQCEYYALTNILSVLYILKDLQKIINTKQIRFVEGAQANLVHR